MNVLSAVILVVLAVIGAATVAHELSLRLFRYRGEISLLYITPVKNSEDAEAILRSAAVQMGRGKARCAVCLDCAMDEQTRRICETLCRDYGFLRLVTREELRGELRL